MSKVLVIAAHPDDELLGCGGALIRHTDQGDEIQSIIMCEGESLRYEGKEVNQHEATLNAAKIIGISKTNRFDFPDQRLDKYSLVDLIAPIEKVVNTYQPEIVYVQFGGDINRDHALTFEAASIALRPTTESVREIYAFYTVGSTELKTPAQFNPNVWVNVENQIDRKIRAFSCYASEIREYPHPRSLEGIRNVAAFYGNQCCMKYAEAFMLMRKVERASVSETINGNGSGN